MKLRKSISRTRTIIFLFLGACMLHAQVLPEANHENTMYMLPLWEAIEWDTNVTSDDVVPEINKLKAQLGEGNLYHKIGFSYIHGTGNRVRFLEHCRMARENGIVFGVICAYQTHSMGGHFTNIFAADFRNYQWRLDGVTWQGVTNGGPREHSLPSPSRYAGDIRDKFKSLAENWAGNIVTAMEMYPGVISVVNIIVEEELAGAGQSNDGYLSDYSPFAVAEFRDWLLHKGIYDAAGEHTGQGAPAAITGQHIQIQGALRSPFWDDPSPSNSNGTGTSFNQHFGTNFSTWKLRYWDLESFPDSITDENFDPSPESGPGYTSGGFDAPRTRNASAWWKAWSWDYFDRGGYPPGNPDNPAFGFRQVMVRNFIMDFAQTLIDANVPEDLIYPHQIPVELIEPKRCRSSASPAWTGYLPQNDKIGITRFGPMDPTIATQYSGDWGIFEWHPVPGADADEQRLYNGAADHLQRYYNAKVHVLFPGWWGGSNTDGQSHVFPLTDSRFADAIKDFLAPLPEKPFHDRDQGTTAYIPPPVHEIVLSDTPEGGELAWSEFIWPAQVDKWSRWSDFDKFEVQYSVDEQTWLPLGTTDGYSLSIPADIYNQASLYRIRAVSGQQKAGEWVTTDNTDINEIFREETEAGNSFVWFGAELSELMIKLNFHLKQKTNVEVFLVDIRGQIHEIHSGPLPGGNNNIVGTLEQGVSGLNRLVIRGNGFSKTVPVIIP